MYVKKSTEYQNHPCIIKVLEDVVGGGTIAKSDLVQTDELKAGVVVGVASGLYHKVKTAKVHTAIGATDVALKVYKGHDFKVGDFVTDSALSKKAYAITVIDYSNADYDTLTIGTAIGAVLINLCLVQAAAESATTGVYKYAPVGITMNSVDLTLDNMASGILVRGTVNESLLEHYVDASVKALLPHIRFV